MEKAQRLIKIVLLTTHQPAKRNHLLAFKFSDSDEEERVQKWRERLRKKILANLAPKKS